MNDQHNMGLKGRLPKFINAFRSDRKFRVLTDSTLSNIQNQEEGVPEGRILSVILFNIKINSINNCLNPGVDKFGTLHSMYKRTAECQLHRASTK